MDIYLLDMGQTKFGDCILITHADRTILIDAAHIGDTNSIKGQLANILQTNPPFTIDLLIITHCHSDHIGCGPNLVRQGLLKVSTALVADEKLGFGRNANGDGPADAVFSTGQKALMTALMEEDFSNLKTPDLEAFLMDAAKLEDNYKFMLTQLQRNGTRVVRFKGSDKTNGLDEIENEFRDFGLKILGPIQEHLLICADALASSGDAMAELILGSTPDSIGMGALVEQYRILSKTINTDQIAGQDMPGPGAAKNNQSIVIKVESDGWKALLAADMQFARSEVRNLNPFMEKLLSDVNQQGPYDFIKLTHHSSDNGTDDVIIDEWLKHTTNFAHSGGVNDPTHPDKDVLKFLKARSEKLKYARTDRNGLITVKKDGVVSMKPSKGRLNDFSLNEDLLMQNVPVVESKGLQPQQKQPALIQPQAGVEPAKAPLAAAAYDMVEVVTKIPHVNTRVTITIDVDTEKKKNGPDITKAPKPPFDPPKGRLDNLTFVTNSKKLADNIGTSECADVMSFIGNIPNAVIIDLPENITDAKEAWQLVVQKGSKTSKGVLIIGGYDVVPSLQIDAISKDMRQKLKAAGKDGYDADNFIVWSDDIYGDLDGDIIPELPVSRIPDGRSAKLVFNALNAPPFQANTRFGIRNIARPFAKDIFEILPGDKPEMETSEMFGPTDFESDTAKGAVYYMLHGSYQDSSKFWGETEGGDEFEAININKIPVSAPGTIVFTGCCWGALTVYPPACFAAPGKELKPRLLEESLALKYLMAGSQAFVGCTGSHYSPLLAPYNYFGKPMHDSFWQGINQNMSPAEALFYAKKEYARKIPHGQKDLFSQAVETKIMWQYTCLGLGW